MKTSRMVSDDFKLLSLNVRGLSNFKKRRAVFTMEDTSHKRRN